MKHTLIAAAAAAAFSAAAAPPTLAQVQVAPDRSIVHAIVQLFHRAQGSTVFYASVQARTCREGVGVLYAATVAGGEPEPVDVLLVGDAYADTVARALCARLFPYTTKGML